MICLLDKQPNEFARGNVLEFKNDLGIADTTDLDLNKLISYEDRLRNAAENKDGDYPEHVIKDLYATWHVFNLLEKEFPDSFSEDMDIVLCQSERKQEYQH